jgi:DNA invertase Pin-like site-specific DNA recombinase
MNDDLMKVKIAIYIRVSTEDQVKEGYSHSFAYARLGAGVPVYRFLQKPGVKT